MTAGHETVNDCWQRHCERPFHRALASHEHGYPLVYLTDKGQCLCATCANSQEYGEPVSCAVHWEGEPLECSGCLTEIESAYGPVQENVAREEEKPE